MTVFRVEFLHQYSTSDKPNEQPSSRKGRENCRPLNPTIVYDVLPAMKSAANMFQRGKQEDAEEFLTCLLNTLHEEIGEAIKQNCKEKGTSPVSYH